MNSNTAVKDASERVRLTIKVSTTKVVSSLSYETYQVRALSDALEKQSTTVFP